MLEKHTYYVSKVFQAPLKFVYSWLTDYREDDNKLTGSTAQRKILQKTRHPTVEAPSALQEAIKSIRELTSSNVTYKTQEQTLGMEAADMPPCIKNLLETLSSGGRLSHVGRFTLTSFLVNTGATEDEVMNFFKSASDFDERKTRYQVEHIAGRRGSRRKYTAPNCNTMRTHGLCVNPDALCATITHPLTYYRRKAKILFREGRSRSTRQPRRETRE